MAWCRLKKGYLVFLDYETEQPIMDEYKNEYKRKNGKELDMFMQGKEIDDYTKFRDNKLQSILDKNPREFDKLTYKEFFFESAETVGYEWIRNYTEAYPEFVLDIRDDSNVMLRDELNLSLPINSCLKQFWIHRLLPIKNGIKVSKEITDSYWIDITKLASITGTLNRFIMAFKDGTIYIFDDGVMNGYARCSVLVQCINERRLVNQIYENRKNLGILQTKKQMRIPLSFDVFMEFMNRRFTDIDERFDPVVNEDGSVDLIYRTIYGSHVDYKIDCEGRLYSVKKDVNTNQETWIKVFDAIIELVNIPEYKHKI